MFHTQVPMFGGTHGGEGRQPLVFGQPSYELWSCAPVADRKFYVYLCGPMSGRSFEDCDAYYKQVAGMLPSWIVPLSPLRGWVNQGQPLGNTYENYGLDSQKGIFARDYYDVSRCDLVFANFLGATKVSIGSIFEVAWAYQMRKPLVVVMEDAGNPNDHPFVRVAADYWQPTLEAGIDVLIKTLTPGI